MATSVTGVFIASGKVNLVGQNNTKIRKFWLNLTGNSAYENHGEFRLMGEKCAIVDDLKKGQEVEVFFNINGRKSKYINKDTGEEKEGFFQELNAWKIAIIERKSAGVAELNPESIAKSGEDDDLPF